MEPDPQHWFKVHFYLDVVTGPAPTSKRPSLPINAPGGMEGVVEGGGGLEGGAVLEGGVEDGPQGSPAPHQVCRRLSLYFVFEDLNKRFTKNRFPFFRRCKK